MLFATTIQQPFLTANEIQEQIHFTEGETFVRVQADAHHTIQWKHLQVEVATEMFEMSPVETELAEGLGKRFLGSRLVVLFRCRKASDLANR